MDKVSLDKTRFGVRNVFTGRRAVVHKVCRSRGILFARVPSWHLTRVYPLQRAEWV